MEVLDVFSNRKRLQAPRVVQEIQQRNIAAEKRKRMDFEKLGDSTLKKHKLVSCGVISSLLQKSHLGETTNHNSTTTSTQTTTSPTQEGQERRSYYRVTSWRSDVDQDWFDKMRRSSIKQYEKAINASYDDLPANNKINQGSDRNAVVQTLFDAAGKLGMHQTTVHLASHLYDRLVQSGTRPGTTDELLGYSITCLRLSAKYEEMELDIPKTPCFLRRLGVAGREFHLEDKEMHLLNAVDWTVGTVTAAHFLEFYVFNNVLMDYGDLFDGRPLSRENWMDVAACIERFCRIFIDLAITQIQFHAYPSLVLFASALAASRGACGVFPVWSTRLTELTGYQFDDLQACYDHLQLILEPQFYALSPTYSPQPRQIKPVQGKTSPKAVYDLP